MDCTCYDARITYTRLHSSDNHATEVAQNAGGIWITDANPAYVPRVLIANATDQAFARQHLTTEFNGVDLEVGSRVVQGCNFSLRAHAGLHYTYIRTDRIVNYGGHVTVGGQVPTTIDVEGHNRAWGIGPRFGLDAHCDIACGFGLGAHTGLGILAGENRAKFHEHVLIATIDETLDVAQSTRCVVFPEIDAAIGLNYLFCRSDCFSLLVEVGYEWRAYIGVLDHTVFNDPFGATSSARCETFNLDGLYISFRLQI